MGFHFLSKGPIDQISGGYLYNRYLVEHLRGAGIEVTYHPSAAELGQIGTRDVLIVDSLALDDSAGKLLTVPAHIVLLLHVVPDAAALGEHGESVLAALYRRARVVVTGNSTLTSVRDRLASSGIDAVKIEPGVPAHWRAKAGYSDRARRLLGVANYLPGKGVGRLIESLAPLRHLAWHLTVRGNTKFDPEFYAAMRRKVIELGLAGRVELLGPVAHDTVNEEMLGADLLVHWSRYESYSMVTAEAIASGLPVLSYRTGNADEFSRSGLVRHVDDRTDRDALRTLIAHGDDYRRLRRSGRRHLRTWSDVGSEFVDWLGSRCRR
jgi:glycosyltransferase involved in cell wall biosynthesis